MSKGNMLFSQARGKVGDLVFSRLDGEQIVRSRNRHPKNPKTIAQLFQRAIMATVLRAYSAGKVIFDHAFEGKQVGAQCQRYFLSENAKRLRAAIAADLEAGNTGETCTARVVAPGVQSPVPNFYVISTGTLEPSCISVRNGFPIPVENEKIGAYAERNGLVNGHLHTIVMMGCASYGNDEDVLFRVNGTTDGGGCQTIGGLAFIRLRVNIAEADLETAITAQTPVTKLMTIDETYNCYVDEPETWPISGNTFLDQISLSRGLVWGKLLAGVIHSIEDEGLRSNTVLSRIHDDDIWGIESQYVLAAWKQGTTALGDSELILEGGDL